MRINRKIWLFVCLCAPILGVNAQSNVSITTEPPTKKILELLPLIQQSLQVHPAIRAAENDINAARLDKAAVQRQRYLTPSAQLQFTEDYRSAKIAIEQPLWTAGRLSSSQEKASFDYQMAVEGDQAKRYDIAMKVLDAWGLLLDAHERMAVASQTLKELDEFAAMMGRRVNTGVSARVELDLVESRILQSRVAYENAQQMIRLGLARLAQLLNDNQLLHSDFVLPDLLALSEQLKNSYQPDFMLHTDELGRNHPLVQQAQDLAKATEKQADIVRASRFPQVAVGYQYDSQHYYHQPSQNQDGTQLYLSVQYNPGAGWSSRLNEQSLRAKASGLEENIAAVHQQVVDQIHQQLYSFLSAQGRIKTLETAMNSARLVQQSYQRQFIAGHKSWLDVMNATREIEQTAYDLSSTRSALIISCYQLKLLTGELESVLNADPLVATTIDSTHLNNTRLTPTNSSLFLLPHEQIAMPSFSSQHTAQP